MTAEELIATEVARQDRMWGSIGERKLEDIGAGQFVQAAGSQLAAVDDQREGMKHAFECYDWPRGWSGFRDYGSDVANIVVAASFLTQELRRLLANGADTTRTSRDVEENPYEDTQPAVIEA